MCQASGFCPCSFIPLLMWGFNKASFVWGSFTSSSHFPLVCRAINSKFTGAGLFGSFWCCPLPNLSYLPCALILFQNLQSKSWVPHCQENRADLVTTQALNGVAGAVELNAGRSTTWPHAGTKCWCLPQSKQTLWRERVQHWFTVKPSQVQECLTWSMFHGSFPL